LLFSAFLGYPLPPWGYFARKPLESSYLQVGGVLQNIDNTWVAHKILLINELAPEGVFYPCGLFLLFLSIFIIWVGVELKCQLDLVLFVWFSWFWGLTCDFGRKMIKEKQ
jgi:hypothetical protein